MGVWGVWGASPALPCGAASVPTVVPLTCALPTPPDPHRPLPAAPAARRSFIFHYAVGAQLARHVRLHAKLPQPQAGASSSPAYFLAGVLLSSTVLWQALDALM